MKPPNNYLLGILTGVSVLTSAQAADHLSRIFANNIYSTMTVSGTGALAVNGGLRLTSAPAATHNAAGRVTQNAVAGGLNTASGPGCWTSLNITAPAHSAVTLGPPSGGLQSVTISIPKALAGPAGKLFGRLHVSQPWDGHSIPQSTSQL